MAELYPLLRLAHIGLVIATISFFMVRAAWSLAGSANLAKPWVRVAPHVVDTLLLASAIALAVTSRQYPFQLPWLTAKVAALVLYIVFGSLAIKRARSRATRGLFLVLAVLTFVYMVAVAITKTPLPLP